MSYQNFSDIKNNAQSNIEEYFSFIDKKNYFPEKDFDPTPESGLILTGLHVVISDQINQFMKHCYDAKMSAVNCHGDDIGGFLGIVNN